MHTKQLLGKAVITAACLLVVACGTHRRAQAPMPDLPASEEPAPQPQTTIDYKGAAWTANISQPPHPPQGLQGRHLAVWASHGRYYNQAKGLWEWQRPNLFCTNEDLFTQTITVPYLMPMLELAGANVFSPRERDWQPHEIIVDNDNLMIDGVVCDNTPLNYSEINLLQTWKDCPAEGFGAVRNIYTDRINPFTEGTTRMVKASEHKGCEIIYRPYIEHSGEYAVYVCYPTVEGSVPDAKYTVHHKGRTTEFSVNQRMGGSTWVYLGTFEFEAGCSDNDCVTLCNVSDFKGVVTADAVRFGGGSGNITRGTTTSGMPRCLEGSRYYAQWAGAPDSVCYSKDGTDDYKEDINVRSLMTNWLAGGSVYAPNAQGLNVPIELTLAVHSDAGYQADGSSLVGSLAICTTTAGSPTLADGRGRDTSKEFASLLLDNIESDISSKYFRWRKRFVKDANYSETRCPVMPSAIIETLSHQNFPDMQMGQDPNFRFTLARSIYKTILRFLSDQHGTPYTVAPLTPTNICVELLDDGMAVVRWDAVADPAEESALPTGFILYTATHNAGFDNGILVEGNACKLKMEPGVLYNFRVTAVNDGGESFRTATVSAVYNPKAQKTIIVVNVFQRLSEPANINSTTQQGFDLKADMGVPYIKTMGFCGSQQVFDKTKIGGEGPGALGYSGSELEGKTLRGNEFNYITTHTQAIMASGDYNVASCSKYALEARVVTMGDYDCIDLLLGLEKDDGHSLLYYKTFSDDLQDILAEYTKNGGHLIVSGSFVGSDMQSEKERSWLATTLNAACNASLQLDNDTLNGMGTTLNIYTQPNEQHYAAQSVDVLTPVGNAFCTITDSQGRSVGVAANNDRYRTVTLGFPFECITSDLKRTAIMKAMLSFVLHNNNDNAAATGKK